MMKESDTNVVVFYLGIKVDKCFYVFLVSLVAFGGSEQHMTPLGSIVRYGKRLLQRLSDARFSVALFANVSMPR
jgi:hypothetical protein